jgi:hypothetical protein
MHGHMSIKLIGKNVEDSECGHILCIVFAIARFKVLSLVWRNAVSLGGQSPTF